MKYKSWVFICMIVVFGLLGCTSTFSTVKPTKTEFIQASTYVSTSIPLAAVTQSISPTIIPFMTPTTINTLMPKEIDETIISLLKNPTYCPVSCFWGITPGQTTIGEAEDIFRHLGFQMFSTTNEGKNFSGIYYELENGLSFTVTLEVQNSIVENIEIVLTPSMQTTGFEEELLAYSPATLIKHYGVPSRVDFFADWGPGPFFAMQMYFDAEDLIVQYAGDNIIPGQKGSSQVCPLTAQFDSVWLWMGKNPHDPPGFGVPLETVSSLTLNSFSKLMTGDPENACFIFNGDAINNSRK